VGEEAFTVTATSGGLRIVSEAKFITNRPTVHLSLSFDRLSPSEFAFQLRRSSSPAAQFYAVLGRGKLTLRRVEAGLEQAAESRGTPDLVPLVDSMVAPLLQMVTPPADTLGRVTAVFPQGARRVAVEVVRARAPDGTTTVTLSGGVDASLTLAADGALLRASIPALGLEAERQSP
jgi:hypothetical protein